MSGGVERNPGGLRDLVVVPNRSVKGRKQVSSVSRSSQGRKCRWVVGGSRECRWVVGGSRKFQSSLRRIAFVVGEEEVTLLDEEG